MIFVIEVYRPARNVISPRSKCTVCIIVSMLATLYKPVLVIIMIFIKKINRFKKKSIPPTPRSSLKQVLKVAVVTVGESRMTLSLIVSSSWKASLHVLFQLPHQTHQYQHCWKPSPVQDLLAYYSHHMMLVKCIK